MANTSKYAETAIFDAANPSTIVIHPPMNRQGTLLESS